MESDILALQAYIRGYLVRRHLRERKLAWSSNEQLVVKLQARVRGANQRKEYIRTREHYGSEENLSKIVKVQAYVKGKVLGKAYKDLDASEIPVKTVQSFIHLLDDSDRDFEEEKGMWLCCWVFFFYRVVYYAWV